MQVFSKQERVISNQEWTKSVEFKNSLNRKKIDIKHSKTNFGIKFELIQPLKVVLVTKSDKNGIIIKI